MSGDYIVDVCPKCNEFMNYYPNPYDFVKHRPCGYEGFQIDMIQAVDVNALNLEIEEGDKKKKRLQDLLERLPHVIDGKLVEE